MSSSYHLQNIKSLMMQEFSKEVLCYLCYDTPSIRIIYDRLTRKVTKDKLVKLILDFAADQSAIEVILAWAQEYNPTAYTKYLPYYANESSNEFNSVQEESMDPNAIVSAIVTGIATGIATSTTDLASKRAIVDAYENLKSVIKRKFGDESKIAKAIRGCTDNPASEGRKIVLHEEVIDSQANQDLDVIKASQAILDLTKDNSETITIIGDSNVIGNQNRVNFSKQQARDHSVQISKQDNKNVGQ